MDLLKVLAGDVFSQTVVVAVVGHLMQALAQFATRHQPPTVDDRTSAVLHVSIIFVSLVMAFLQQWLTGHLDTFDPKPWQDFAMVLIANWGVIFAKQQAPKHYQKMMRKLRGKNV